MSERSEYHILHRDRYFGVYLTHRCTTWHYAIWEVIVYLGGGDDALPLPAHDAVSYVTEEEAFDAAWRTIRNFVDGNARP